MNPRIIAIFSKIISGVHKRFLVALNISHVTLLDTAALEFDVRMIRLIHYWKRLERFSSIYLQFHISDHIIFDY